MIYLKQTAEWCGLSHPNIVYNIIPKTKIGTRWWVLSNASFIYHCKHELKFHCDFEHLGCPKSFNAACADELLTSHDFSLVSFFVDNCAKILHFFDSYSCSLALILIFEGLSMFFVISFVYSALISIFSWCFVQLCYQIFQFIFVPASPSILLNIIFILLCRHKKYIIVRISHFYSWVAQMVKLTFSKFSNACWSFCKHPHFYQILICESHALVP